MTKTSRPINGEALGPLCPRILQVLLVTCSLGILLFLGSVHPTYAQKQALGRELSTERHLIDDTEVGLPLELLLKHGRQLFNANWTDQEGGGRPLTKGTGRPLADPNQPLTDARAFNRISGPDSNSCAGCHNAPYGIAGGGGDFVTNVFLLGQRFDFL